MNFVLQMYSTNHTNLILSPFGLATSIAITMDCVHGESFEEITKLFKLHTKQARQQLRTGFKTVLHDFKVMYLFSFMRLKTILYFISARLFRQIMENFTGN